jgi:acetyltransferase-like isoleucine patch superfamily enzyme
MLIEFRNKLEKLILRIYSIIIRNNFYPGSGKFYIAPSVRIDNPKNIIIESGVSLLRRGWIYAMSSKKNNLLIRIGSGTKIHDNFHITAGKNLIIGRNCLINRNVLITDTIHNYENIDIPIIDQGIRSTDTVIGDDCWIGNNVAIVCSHIGKHCVIGANTVIVNKSIPDYSVVAGNPGKVIKQYAMDENKWNSIKTNS